jgi:serine/threonine-protein kinase
MVSFKPGDIIGSYRVVRPLGKGGMGAVYEVEHVKLGVHYALKTFVLNDKNEELFLKRFQAEGRILARLRHPGLVRVFDLDIEPLTAVFYYVMDLVLYKDGEAYSLADLDQGGADEEHIAQWFGELCDALAYVHQNGIVHRDIKLGNILLAPERHVVLSDFGISKVCDEKLRTDIDVSRTFVTGDTSRLVMGTAGYMAPEILRGVEASPASDVYSLGVVFFKLLTGVWYEPCLASGERAAFRLLDNFEYKWREILPAMLDADPAKRPTDLKALSDSLLSQTKPVASQPQKRSRIWYWLLAVIGAAVIAVSCIAGWMLLFEKGQNEAQDKAQDKVPDKVPDKVQESLGEAFGVPESVK